MDLGGDQNEPHRQRLARHFVQRRRGDIRSYLDEDTPFPEREELEETYKLSPEYKKLFERVLRYARETVTDAAGDRRRQRVRWWSALALLRSLASSPAAAAATLRTRAAAADTETPEEADEIGRRTVLDLMDADAAEGTDVIPGGDADEDDEATTPRARRRLLEMAREADALRGAKDAKLQKAIALVAELLQGRLPPHRLLPLHPHGRVRGRGPAQGACQGHRGGRGHRHPAAGRARGAGRRPRRAADAACWSAPTA